VPTVCAETQGESPLAAVYRLPAGATKAQPFAFGLRNSMALAVHSSGTVLQAENNIDFPDERFPAEEINVLRAGQHHGWPFCVENRKPVFGATAASCAATVAPVLTFPAHAAPMAIRYSRAWAKPGEQEALLMSWHGYRASGHRLVRYSVKPDGTPTGAPDVLVDFSWVDDQGAKRQGSPVGFDEDADGQLWIADDRNRLLLLLRKLTPGGAAPIRTDTPPPPPPR
jgi:glucose/arabinose dehydrogenase